MKNGKIVLAEVGVGPVSMAFGKLVWDRPDIEVLMFEPHPKYYSEEDQILQEIELLRKKPNKTRRDRDNLSLLEIKLEQLYKFR